MLLQSPRSAKAMPGYANAGLNYYVGAFCSVGVLQQGVLARVVSIDPLFITLLVSAELAASFLAPILGARLISRGAKMISAGFMARFATTGLLVLIILVAWRQDAGDGIELLALTYLAAFFGLSLTHKIAFNIGWLYVMNAAMHGVAAGPFVGRVRRLNTLVSIVLTIMTTFILSVSPSAGLAFVAVAGLGYALWVYVVAKQPLLGDPGYAKRLGDVLPRVRLVPSLSEFGDAIVSEANRGWIVMSIVPALLAPPLLTSYLASRTAIPVEHAVGALLIGQVIAALLLPNLMQYVRTLGAETAVGLSILSSVIGVLLLGPVVTEIVAPKTSLVLIVLANVLGSSSCQIISIGAHLRVLAPSSADAATRETYLRYSVYNLVLDIVPLSWLFVASALIALDGAAVTIGSVSVHVYYVVCLSAPLVALALSKFSQRGLSVVD